MRRHAKRSRFNCRRMQTFCRPSHDPSKVRSGETGELEKVLYTLIQGILYVSMLIYPFMPSCVESIRQYLNVQTDLARNFQEDWGVYLERVRLKQNIHINQGAVLFPKIENEKRGLLL